MTSKVKHKLQYKFNINYIQSTYERGEQSAHEYGRKGVLGSCEILCIDIQVD